MDSHEVVAPVLAGQLHEAALERMKEMLQSRLVDRIVSRECIKYMTFVDANELKSGNIYINRLAVIGGESEWSIKLDKSYPQLPPMLQ
jgi:hypothetical protein